MRSERFSPDADSFRLPLPELRQSHVVTNWFTVLAPLFEALIIIAAAVATGAAYHVFAYGDVGQPVDFAILGALAAFWYVLLFSYRTAYTPENFLESSRGAGSVLQVWTAIFVGLLLIGFLTKTSDLLSRGTLISFYVIGLALLLASDQVLHSVVRSAAQSGRLQVRRLMLVGTEETIRAFHGRGGYWASGYTVVSQNVLPSTDELKDMPDAALRTMLRGDIEDARGTDITDIVVLVDSQHVTEVNRIADTLRHLPAAIHIGGLDILEQFPGLTAEKVGRLRTIQLVRAPLSFSQKLAKRMVDVLLALVALTLLSPLMIAVAVLVRLDSKGPSLFRQTRRGYNQVEFQIFKFRTMTTMENGPSIQQARENDARFTRIGEFLRRTNIDELPQLINVLRGEMSLVGPRPHAVAHDVEYGELIEQYGRRLNVKPGISGWAQINGFRGPTRDEAAMRERVAHDLYYVDHWSLWLDLKIMLMTVLSRKAYRNAL